VARSVHRVLSYKWNCRTNRGGALRDPRDRSQENALDKRENGQKEALTGVTGGFESRDGVSGEDAEPENHIRETDDHEGGSRAVSKASTHAGDPKVRSRASPAYSLSSRPCATNVPHRSRHVPHADTRW
jgi:hypothetical protein